MTTFSDRQRGEEAKHARDEEMHFRITARRNRLLGNWAAEKMGLSAAEADAYAKEVIQADFEEVGDEARRQLVVLALDTRDQDLLVDRIEDPRALEQRGEHQL